jgi:hypothetical protein
MDLSDYQFSKLNYIQCKNCHLRIDPIKSKIEESVDNSRYVYGGFMGVVFILVTIIWFVVIFSQMSKIYSTSKIVRNFTNHG